MANFFGTYTNKVDDKGRVSVPARFRNAIAGSSYQGVMLSPDAKLGAIDGCDFERIDRLVAAIDDPATPAAEKSRARTLMTRIQEQPIDKAGRIVLPKELSELAGIADSAVFAGTGPTFQIWSPSGFKKHAAAGEDAGSIADLPVAPRTSGSAA